MKNDTMRNRIWLLLTLATLACKELIAEPIVDDAFDVMTTEVLDTLSTDAYACQIIPDATGEDAPVRDGDTLIFERWANGYSEACVQATGPEQTACWTPGVDCDDESRPCALIELGRDAETGETVMAGGTYMVCAHPCTSDDDCPAPSSGTAVATCVNDPALYGSRNLFPESLDSNRGFQYTGGGSCMIGCAGGEICPDGFTCSVPNRSAISSDGEVLLSAAPAQCLQFKAVTLRE